MIYLFLLRFMVGAVFHDDSLNLRRQDRGEGEAGLGGGGEGGGGSEGGVRRVSDERTSGWEVRGRGDVVSLSKVEFYLLLSARLCLLAVHRGNIKYSSAREVFYL